VNWTFFVGNKRNVKQKAKRENKIQQKKKKLK